MSLEFFPCDRCGETICDAGDWWTCKVCQFNLCDECELATSAANRITKKGDPNPGCPFCRREDATEVQLLSFAMELLGVDHDELMEISAIRKIVLEVPLDIRPLIRIMVLD